MVLTASWMRGAQGQSRQFTSVADAEAWLRLSAGALALSAERCHLRLVEGVPTPWTKSPVIAHYTHDRGEQGWRLVAGSPLAGIGDYAEPLPAAAE